MTDALIVIANMIMLVKWNFQRDVFDNAAFANLCSKLILTPLRRTYQFGMLNVRTQGRQDPNREQVSEYEGLNKAPFTRYQQVLTLVSDCQDEALGLQDTVQKWNRHVMKTALQTTPKGNGTIAASCKHQFYYSFKRIKNRGSEKFSK